jgi:hypothetical protein
VPVQYVVSFFSYIYRMTYANWNFVKQGVYCCVLRMFVYTCMFQIHFCTDALMINQYKFPQYNCINIDHINSINNINQNLSAQSNCVK